MQRQLFMLSFLCANDNWQFLDVTDDEGTPVLIQDQVWIISPKFYVSMNYECHQSHHSHTLKLKGWRIKRKATVAPSLVRTNNVQILLDPSSGPVWMTRLAFDQIISGSLLSMQHQQHVRDQDDPCVITKWHIVILISSIRDFRDQDDHCVITTWHIVILISSHQKHAPNLSICLLTIKRIQISFLKTVSQ